jgi:hypothetical protein
MPGGMQTVIEFGKLKIVHLKSENLSLKPCNIIKCPDYNRLDDNFISNLMRISISETFVGHHSVVWLMPGYHCLCCQYTGRGQHVSMKCPIASISEREM